MANLYGRLVARTNSEYQRMTSVLHKFPKLINAFDIAMQRFNLEPCVNPSQDGGIALTATSKRGADSAALLESLTKAGFHIGQAYRLLQQFNDGYVMWTVPVRNAELEFTLLFYNEVEVA